LQESAGRISLAINAANEGEVDVFFLPKVAEVSRACPLAQQEIGVSRTVLLVDVGVRRDHEGEMSCDASRCFPLPVIVAVPRRNAELSREVGKGGGLYRLPARRLVKD
jgi:hypothetical protein